jgi:hypothetical protein
MYFPEYSSAFSESLADEPQIKDPGGDTLPLVDLGDRRFEQLAYRVLCAELGSSDTVLLMQGTGDGGRDVTVHSPDGALTRIVQCKLLTRRMDAGSLRRELMKLCLHGFGNPAVLGERTVSYELWCPPGLTGPAIDLVGRWPVSWRNSLLEETFEEVRETYASFGARSWSHVHDYCFNAFPSQLAPRIVDARDIATRVRAHTPVHRAFFSFNVVMEADEVTETLRKLLEDAGVRRLTDLDARHLVERMSEFDDTVRLATSSGFVMGVPPELVSKLKREEYGDFLKESIAAAPRVALVLIKACSRLAQEESAAFRRDSVTCHPSLPLTFMQTLTLAMLARMSGAADMGLGLAARMNIEPNAGLSLRDRLVAQGKATWDDCQECLAKYNPQQHSHGSDPEYRARIAHSVLAGAADYRSFAAELEVSVDAHLQDLTRRYERFMRLLPKEILAVSDSRTFLQSEYLMKRVVQTVDRLVELRGSEIVPE